MNLLHIHLLPLSYLGLGCGGSNLGRDAQISINTSTTFYLENAVTFPGQLRDIVSSGPGSSPY